MCSSDLVGLQVDTGLQANVTFAKHRFDVWSRANAYETLANSFRDRTQVPAPDPLHPYAVFHAECLAPVQLPEPKTETTLDSALSEMFAKISYDKSQVVSEQLARQFLTSSNSGVEAGSGHPDRRDAPEPRAAVGTVFDERGIPAARTPVALFGDGPQPIAQTQTEIGRAHV